MKEFDYAKDAERRGPLSNGVEIVPPSGTAAG